MTDLAQRYPRHPGRRLAIVVATVAVALLGTVWLLWTATTHATPEVAGRVKSFQVASDTSVDAVLQVDRRTPSAPARCKVYAQATNYERVGELELDVPPGTERVTDTPVSMRTFRRATSVALERCWTVG